MYDGVERRVSEYKLEDMPTDAKRYKQNMWTSMQLVIRDLPIIKGDLCALKPRVRNALTLSKISIVMFGVILIAGVYHYWGVEASAITGVLSSTLAIIGKVKQIW